MGEELSQTVVKFHVLANNGGDGCGHGFFDVAFDQAGLEAFLGLDGDHENDPGGAAIGAGRSHFRQIPDLFEPLNRHRIFQPTVMGPGFDKQLVECVLVQGACHAILLN